VKKLMSLSASGILITILLLAGCSSSSKDTGQQQATQVVDCTQDPNDADCQDPDKDGLTTGQEKSGWVVLGVNVTSDPYVADTDGDGLDDLSEFSHKTDPRKVDTDGDLLSDSEEVMRWQTNPLALDTDGDAAGPDGTLTPNPELYDGSELKIDFANDPSHTPGKGATSPTVADTDGDDRSDYYEIVEAQGKGFDPVLADLPEIDIEIATSPVIRLTGSTESVKDWSRDLSMTDSLSQSISREAGVSRSTEFAISQTTEIGTEIGFEAGTEGGKVTGNASLSYSLSAAMTTSDAVSWSRTNAKTAEKAYQESMGEGGSEAVTLDGGYVSVNINITNTGNLAYILDDLRINVLARYINGTSDYATVLELKREDNTSVPLAPGDTRTNMMFKSDTTDYELIRSFLKNPSGLMFEVAGYDLTDQNGKSFVFNVETVKQRTAMVVIDYGGEAEPGRYLVATSPRRANDGLKGVNMATVLKGIIGVNYSTTEKTSSATDYRVLSSITPPGGGTVVSNDIAHNKKWLVAVSADLENSDLTDFDKIRLQAGDSVYLMYVRDVDHDKLSAREEALNGTSDTNTDTDGDGLSDYDEIRTGWPVNVEWQVPYTARSRAFAADFDNDTIEDATEKTCGLDPVRADTDQDGIPDIDEINGYDIVDAKGVLVLRVVPYAGPAILDGGNAIIDTTPEGDDVAEASGSITSGAVLVSPGVNGVIDTTPSGDDYVGVTHDALPVACYNGAYATNPLSADTDGDTETDGSEKDIALGSPNNPNDFDRYIDTDGDGLSDAEETVGYSALVNGAWKKFTSDEKSGDTDGDGLPDLLEYLLKSDPRSADTDGDGLSDLDEYDFITSWDNFESKCAVATNCTVPATQGADYGTALTDRDTDGDGLSDKQEIDGWTVTVYKKAPYVVTSDPKNLNSDTDGWNDLAEYQNHTDPRKPDTDDDGTIDDVEATIWTSGWYSPVKSVHRDPLTPDMRVTVTFKEISAGGYLCNPFSSWVWYYFWFDVITPDGTDIYALRANDYCDDRDCDHVAFQGTLVLDGNPDSSFSFLMKESNEEFKIKGLVHNIAVAADPACWLVGTNCATAQWNFLENYTSSTVAGSSTTEYISGGGEWCLSDDQVEVRIDVD